MDNNNEFGWVTEGNNGNEVPNDGSIDLSKYAPKNNPKFTTAISMGRKDGTTIGNNSTALGSGVEASGDYSYAEGMDTYATDMASHAEGKYSHATGDTSHAEGLDTTASGYVSHAEGYNTTAHGDYSHSEGYKAFANGRTSHAEGENTVASSRYQHVQGSWNIEDTANTYAHIVGNGGWSDEVRNYVRSNAHTLDWGGNAWFAGNITIGEDNKELATKEYVDNTVANGGGGGSTPDWNQNDETQSDYIKNRTHYTTEPQLVPFKNIIINLDTDSTDSNNQSYYIWGGLSSDYLVANKEYKVDYNGTIYTCVTKQDPGSSYYYCIGNAYLDDDDEENTGEPFLITTNKTYVVKNNTKVHDIKVCEFKAVDVQIDEKYLNNSPGKKVGGKTFVLNSYTNETAVAEEGAEIFNDYMHNIATGGYSHAEGYGTRARGYASHSEGFRSIASGGYSHVEGYECQATAVCSHAEGYCCYAQAEDSHAEGYNTIARARWQHVEGAFNEPDPEGDVDDKGKYVHIVGNGYGFDNRSNAHTLDWKGNAWYQGNVSVDGTPTNDNDLTTKKYVDDAVANSGGGSSVEWIKFDLYSHYNDVAYGSMASRLDFNGWSHGEELYHTIKDGGIIHILCGVMESGKMTEHAQFIDIPIIPSLHIKTLEDNTIECTAKTEGIYRKNLFTADLSITYDSSADSTSYATIGIELEDFSGQSITSGIHAINVYVEPIRFKSIYDYNE